MIGPVTLADMSVANLTVGGGDPVALIEAAGAAGFGAVGLLLRSAMPKPLVHEIVGRPEAIRAVKDAIRRTGVRVFDVEAFTLAPGVDLDAYKAALATGVELGATHISSIGTEWAGNTAFLTEAERVDLFGRLCDLAGSFGLHVGVEFMLYRDVRTLQDALALIRAAGRANAGVILDVLHFHRAGGVAGDLASVPADRIAYAQLCGVPDANPALDALAAEARTSRLHLGDGAVDLGAFLDALSATTQLVVETPVLADAGEPLEEKVKRTAAAAAAFFDTRYRHA